MLLIIYSLRNEIIIIRQVQNRQKNNKGIKVTVSLFLTVGCVYVNRCFEADHLFHFHKLFDSVRFTPTCPTGVLYCWCCTKVNILYCLHCPTGVVYCWLCTEVNRLYCLHCPTGVLYCWCCTEVNILYFLHWKRTVHAM